MATSSKGSKKTGRPQPQDWVDNWNQAPKPKPPQPKPKPKPKK